jgi:hypothetical protein
MTPKIRDSPRAMMDSIPAVPRTLIKTYGPLAQVAATSRIKHRATVIPAAERTFLNNRFVF